MKLETSPEFTYSAGLPHSRQDAIYQYDYFHVGDTQWRLATSTVRVPDGPPLGGWEVVRTDAFLLGLGGVCRQRGVNGAWPAALHIAHINTVIGAVFLTMLKGTYYENSTFLVLLHVNLGIWHVYRPKNSGKKLLPRFVMVLVRQKRHA